MTPTQRGHSGGVLEDRLRALGYNARSVGRIFHGDPGDPEILALARIIGGRVLTYDQDNPRTGSGFYETAIHLDPNLRPPPLDSITSTIDAALGIRRVITNE